MACILAVEAAHTPPQAAGTMLRLPSLPQLPSTISWCLLFYVLRLHTLA
jgi:hypothetical protein